MVLRRLLLVPSAGSNSPIFPARKFTPPVFGAFDLSPSLLLGNGALHCTAAQATLALGVAPGLSPIESGELDRLAIIAQQKVYTSLVYRV